MYTLFSFINKYFYGRLPKILRNKVCKVIMKVIREVCMYFILSTKFLVKNANSFKGLEFLLICSKITSQEQLDALYEACSIEQRASLLFDLDGYRMALTSPSATKKCKFYLSTRLLERDYYELIKLVQPLYYEPTEVTLEHKFSW